MINKYSTCSTANCKVVKVIVLSKLHCICFLVHLTEFTNHFGPFLVTLFFYIWTCIRTTNLANLQDWNQLVTVFLSITLFEVGPYRCLLIIEMNTAVHTSNPPYLLFYMLLKVHSYYNTIALWCWYIEYISATSHRSITTFQVKINLTYMRHCNNIAWVCSGATQRNCRVVWTDSNSLNSAIFHTSLENICFLVHLTEFTNHSIKWFISIS